MQAIVDESDVAVGALEDAREDPGAVDFSTRDSGYDEQEHDAEEETDRPRGIRDPGRARSLAHPSQNMVQTLHLRQGQGQT